MKTIINLTTCKEDLARFQDHEDLQAFYEGRGLSGLEIMSIGDYNLNLLQKQDVLGIHLYIPPYWLELWKENKEALIKEFDSLETCECYFGGITRQTLLDSLHLQLEFAKTCHVEYVVIHVSDVSLNECITYKFQHSDEEVIDAACDLINEIMEGRGYCFELLVENLWWPGFSFTNPLLTKRLMEGIRYFRKGIMLDLGHLLHTNRNLRSQEEGIRYIYEQLENHRELLNMIRGVHLHQSMSGEYAENLINNPPELAGGYYERLGTTYLSILKIDTHQPFTGRGIKELIETIAPEYVTIELISHNRKEHEQMIDEQLNAIR